MEGERGAPTNPEKYKQLRSAVEHVLETKGNAWEQEQQTSVYKAISRDVAGLRTNIFKRKAEPAVCEEPFTEMTYGAAAHLMNALREVLHSPLRVGNLPPGLGGGGANERVFNHNRNIFINNILDTLQHMNVSLADLQEVADQNELNSGEG